MIVVEQHRFTVTFLCFAQVVLSVARIPGLSLREHALMTSQTKNMLTIPKPLLSND